MSAYVHEGALVFVGFPDAGHEPVPGDVLRSVGDEDHDLGHVPPPAQHGRVLAQQHLHTTTINSLPIAQCYISPASAHQNQPLGCPNLSPLQSFQFCCERYKIKSYNHTADISKYLPLQKLSVLSQVLNVFKAVVDVPSFVHRGHGLLSESSKSKLVITGSALDGLDSTDEISSYSNLT